MTRFPAGGKSNGQHIGFPTFHWNLIFGCTLFPIFTKTSWIGFFGF